MTGGYSGVIAYQKGISSNKASWTTAVSVLNPTGLVTIPSNYLYVDKLLRINALLYLSNVVTAQPTFTFQVMLGPTANIIIWSSGALTSNTAAHTGFPCKVVVDLRCNAVGSGTSANFSAIGTITSQALVISGATGDPVLTHSTFIMPAATVATPSSGGAGFDSTVANILDFWMACQTSNSGNNVTVYEYFVEDLN